MLDYAERKNKLKKVSDFIDEGKTFDDWYRFLINEWIIDQPDKSELMELFIRLEFNPLKFVRYVIIGNGFKQEEEK